MKSITIFFLFSFAFLLSCSAQKQGNLYSQNKKAIKFYDDAILFYQNQRFDDAAEYLSKAIVKDSNFIEAYLLLADIYQTSEKPEDALNQYRRVIEINADYRPHTYFQAANVAIELMKYDEAQGYLHKYLASPKSDPRNKLKVNRLIDQCIAAKELVANPVKFNPVNMGPNINSDFNEYANVITTEGNTFIFTVLHPVQDSKREVEDFFVSIADSSGLWQMRELMGDFVNSPADEGAMVISPDGKLMVFASNRNGGYGRFDLFYSVLKSGRWTKPMNMGGQINTNAWESQPSISSDGKTLFFVSDRSGGLGGSDIYSATIQEDGSFGNVQNLGAPVNTFGNEMTPYIHHDATTLFFVSNGHPGMGQSDIFYAKKNSKGVFETVKNIGYPINSPGNELGIVVDAKGELAYISSNKEGGFGGYDIYNFLLPNELRPNPVTYLKGVAYDKETKVKLKVKFELIDLKTGEVWIESESDEKTGEFLVCVPSGAELGLNAYREGYLFYSDHFNVNTTDLDKPFLKNVPLTPVKNGEKIILRNILFATNSFELRPESNVELNKLFDLLTNNPKLKIEISGHTDNVGDDQSNLSLSLNRAKAVYNYLIDKGISAERLTYKGYGESKPIANNETEIGRQENRRTEIMILEL